VVYRPYAAQTRLVAHGLCAAQVLRVVYRPYAAQTRLVAHGLCSAQVIGSAAMKVHIGTIVKSAFVISPVIQNHTVIRETYSTWQRHTMPSHSQLRKPFLAK
jgi:hypothetical protein